MLIKDREAFNIAAENDGLLFFINRVKTHPIKIRPRSRQAFIQMTIQAGSLIGAVLAQIIVETDRMRIAMIVKPFAGPIHIGRIIALFLDGER